MENNSIGRKCFFHNSSILYIGLMQSRIAHNTQPLSQSITPAFGTAMIIMCIAFSSKPAYISEWKLVYSYVVNTAGASLLVANKAFQLPGSSFWLCMWKRSHPPLRPPTYLHNKVIAHGCGSKRTETSLDFAEPLKHCSSFQEPLTGASLWFWLGSMTLAKMHQHGRGLVSFRKLSWGLNVLKC